MDSGERIAFEGGEVRVADEEVTQVVRMVHLLGGAVARPLRDIWAVLSAIDPARHPDSITIELADTELRDALEQMKVIKTLQGRSYAGKLYYNFAGALGRAQHE